MVLMVMEDETGTPPPTSDYYQPQLMINVKCVYPYIPHYSKIIENFNDIFKSKYILILSN